jgi:hypothetical protein
VRQGAGFSSRMIQCMDQPIMCILVQVLTFPPWVGGGGGGGGKSLYDKVSTVI